MKSEGAVAAPSFRMRLLARWNLGSGKLARPGDVIDVDEATRKTLLFWSKAVDA